MAQRGIKKAEHEKFQTRKEGCGVNKTLKNIFDRAVSLVDVDEEGLRARTLMFRGEVNQVPLILVTRAGKPAAEIALGYRHPYRSWKAPRRGEVSLLARSYDAVLEARHVSALAPRLYRIFSRLVQVRSIAWNAHGGSWNHDHLYGITASVHPRDASILRLFEELETVNPAFWYKTRDLAHYLNFFQLRKRKKGFPVTWDEIDKRFRGDKRMAAWKRPHVLAELALRMRRPAFSPVLLEFFAERELISAGEYQEAAAHLTRRIKDPRARILPFVVLPKDADEWRVIDRKEGMPVLFQRILDDGTRTILISERRSEYNERRSRLEKERIPAEPLLDAWGDGAEENNEPGMHG